MIFHGASTQFLAPARSDHMNAKMVNDPGETTVPSRSSNEDGVGIALFVALAFDIAVRLADTEILRGLAVCTILIGLWCLVNSTGIGRCRRRCMPSQQELCINFACCDRSCEWNERVCR